MSIVLVLNFEDRSDRANFFQNDLFPSPEYNIKFTGKEVSVKEGCFQKDLNLWLKDKNWAEEKVGLVFVHVSPLLRDYVKGNPDKLVRMMITWNASWIKDCGLVLYHGGEPPEALKKAISQNESTKKNFNVKLLDKKIDEQKPEFLQKLYALAEKKDWEGFLNCSPETGSGSEHLYLERISILDILLQGYLAISNKEAFFNQGSQKATQEYLVAHGILQGEREDTAKESIKTDRLFRDKNTNGAYGKEIAEVENPQGDGYFWFDECLEEPLPVKVDIDGLETVGTVWDLMIGLYYGSISDIPDEKNLVGLFQRARDEYFFFLKKKAERKS